MPTHIQLYSLSYNHLHQSSCLQSYSFKPYHRRTEAGQGEFRPRISQHTDLESLKFLHYRQSLVLASKKSCSRLHHKRSHHRIRHLSFKPDRFTFAVESSPVTTDLITDVTVHEGPTTACPTWLLNQARGAAAIS